MNTAAYALVTPAKNEGKYIEGTILSVISQTLRPLAWVIVDDGSSDQTYEIAETYARRNPWIVVVRRTAGISRDFASKAHAFAAGCERLKDVAYEYLGNLDADISFPEDYYRRLLDFFETDPGLGVAGGRFYDKATNGRSYLSTSSPDSVRGPVQMFRRRCYEDIGGYMPLPLGGIDAAAEIMARMKGWKVRTFSDLIVLHHRPTGSALWSPLSAMVRNGFQDRYLGYQGLFEAARCGASMAKRPYVIGGLSRFFGYCLSWIRGDPFVLTGETVRFLRREQRGKLVRILRRIVSAT